jgi:drug/metabolite transporter (DMT)-like permease
MDHQTIGTLLVILGAFGWSVRDVANNFLNHQAAAPSVWTIVAMQGAIGLVLNITMSEIGQLVSKDKKESMETILGYREKAWLIIRAVGAFVAIALHIMALEKVDLALASMIHCTAPLFIVLFSRLLLGEPIRLAAVLCMAVCAVGLTLDIAPWQSRDKDAGGGSLPGYALAFGSAIASALAYTSLRALKDVSSTTSLRALYTTLLVGGFLLALGSEGIKKPSYSMWWLFIMVGISTFAAEWLITKGYALATEGACSVAVYKFLTPIFAIGWDLALFKQSPQVLSLVGAALVLLSSAVLVRVQAGHTETLMGEADIDPAPKSAQNV